MTYGDGRINRGYSPRWWLAIVILVLIASLALAACGGDEDQSDRAAAAATATNPPVATEAATTVAATVEAMASPTSDTTDAAAATHTMETPFGPVDLPTSPTRVATFGDQALDVAVAVGIDPVGASASRGAQGVASYMLDHASDVEVFGTLAEPNLEVLVKLQPDVILAEAWITQEQYDAFAKIAPTFVPTLPANDRNNWISSSRQFAEALGRADEGEAMLRKVEERTAEVAAVIGDRAGQSVAVLRWMPQGPVVMSGRTITGQLLSQVGLERTEMAMAIEGGHSDPLSLENLTEIDTDWLFIATLNADAQAALDEARQQPAFQRLKAVQSQQTTAVNGQVWSSASGPYAALAILDDIESAFTR